MEIIDNINKTMKDDLIKEIKKNSKISIASACFSIYAYQELKKQLDNIEQLRFIFTSPTFIKEKVEKESFIYLDYPEKKVYMEQNLKLS